MTYQEQYIATKDSFDAMLKKVQESPYSLNQVCEAARNAARTTAEKNSKLAYEISCLVHKAGEERACQFRNNLVAEVKDFHSKVKALCHIIMTELLATKPVSNDKANTRFGEILFMERISYYDDEGTRWFEPSLCTESMINGIEFEHCYRQMPYSIMEYDWFRTKNVEDSDFENSLPFAFSALMLNPDSEEDKAALVSACIQHAIIVATNKEDLDAAQGKTGSTQKIALGTTVESMFDKVFYPKYAQILKAAFC